MSLPRSMRWLLIGAGAVGLYFGAVEPMVDFVVTRNSESDKIEAVLRRYDAERRARAGAEQQIELGLAKFGVVEFPGDPEARPIEFNTQISEAIARHGLREDATTRSATLGAGPLAGVVGSDKRIERVIKELRITAPPEKVSALIADLERLPSVSAVSQVRIQKPSESEREGRMVNAVFSVETWVVSRKGKAR
jgi:hypothetical protein